MVGERLTRLLEQRDLLTEKIRDTSRGGQGYAQMVTVLSHVLAEIDEIEQAFATHEGTVLDEVKKRREARAARSDST